MASYCVHCGIKLERMDRFCPSCGAVNPKFVEPTAERGHGICPFGRKQEKAKDGRSALALREWSPEPEARPGATIGENGSVTLNIGSVEEAKLAIKQLRLEKKSLGIEKKAVTTERAAVRAERRAEVARQGSMFRGGGKMGRFVWDMQTAGRDADRRRYEARLVPYEAAKAKIEFRQINIDAAIARLEAYVLEQSG